MNESQQNLEYQGVPIVKEELDVLLKFEEILGEPIPLIEEETLIKNGGVFFGCLIKDQHIIALGLYNRGMSAIPVFTIGRLAKLKNLCLTRNNLTKLPDDLRALITLEILNLAQNKLEDVSYFIGSLAHLCVLSLNKNSLTTLPEMIGSLLNLEFLDLRNNPLTSLPLNMRYLSKLKEMYVDDFNVVPVALKEEFYYETRLPREEVSALKVLEEIIGEKLPRKTHITKEIFGYSVVDGHVNAIGLMSVEDLLPSEPLAILENLKLNACFLKKSTILPTLLADRWFQGKIILKEEASILKDLKKFTGKKRLYIFSTLSQAEDYSSKPGIVLDEGHVLYLNLNGCGLEQFPECITRLSNLIHLIVDDNQIIELPESIGNLNQLQKLNFASNPLETLPERVIGQLIQLKSIDGSYNNLTTLPESIGSLSKLTTLNLENNQLTALPESLTQLKNLETLNLESNKLTRLPESMGNLSNLRSIQLQNNLLEELPDSLSNIDKLWIKITNNPFKKIPRWLVEEEYDDEPIPPTEREILTILNFWGSEILGYAWIDHTVKDGHIVKLRSSYNNFRTIPIDLSELTHLESLSFDDNKLEELPSSVGNIKSLKVLQLNGNELKTIPNSIGALENLEKLNLSGNQLESLPESIGQLRSLKELNLENNNLKELPTSIGTLDQLEDLNLLNNPLETVPDSPEKGYFKGFWLPKQEIQALKDLETLIDKPLKSLSRLDHHKVGITVHKGHISGIALNSQGLTSLPESFINFTELQHLYLFDNKLKELPSLISNFKSLKTLYLNENPLTDIPDSIISLPNLVNTDLARENRLMKSDYDALQQLEAIIGETIHEKDRLRYNRPGFKAKGGHITELNLYKFDLSSIPEPIRNLLRLKKLGLKRNNLTAVPDWLAELEELEEINFDDNVDEKGLLSEKMKETFYEGRRLPPEEIQFLNDLKMQGTPLFEESSVRSGGHGFVLKDGHIVELGIASEEKIEIPESIKNLRHLVMLSITDFGIQKMPKTLSEVTSLKYLYLNNNGWTDLLDVFPDIEALANLEELEVLDLRDNQLKTIPEAIGKLQSLKRLNLNSNKINDIPESLGNLLKLVSLNLSKNKLTRIPDIFSQLQSLEELRISNNQLEMLPESIGTLSNLKILDLASNNLLYLPKNIENLNSLNNLRLSSNNLREIPENLANLAKLNKLNLANNLISHIPSNFEDLIARCELDIKNNPITHFPDFIIKPLVKNYAQLNIPNEEREALAYLEALLGETLSSYSWGQVGFIVRQGNVTELRIPNQKLKEVPEIISRFTELQRLQLHENDFSELPDVIGMLQNLVELNLKGNNFTSIPNVILKITTLEKLDLTDNPITDYHILPDLLQLLSLKSVKIRIDHPDVVPAFLLEQFKDKYPKYLDYNLSEDELKILLLLYYELGEPLPIPKKLDSKFTFGCIIEEGHITVLRLEGKQLKSLPPYLTKLSLVELDVSTNFSKFPKGLTRLRSLRKLALRHNYITKLPAEISDLTNLELLDLSFNSLKHLPDSFNQLNSLTVLKLDSNQFKEFPLILSELPDLRELTFSNMDLEELPEKIDEGFPKLEILDLSNCYLKTLPASIGSLKSLSELKLHYNNPLVSLPEEIGQLYNLEFLSINRTSVKDPPKSILKLPNLKTLQARPRDLPEDFKARYHDGRFLNLLFEADLLRKLENIIGRPLPYVHEFSAETSFGFKVEDGHIVGLAISSSDLQELPEELGKLSNLKWLNVSYNKLNNLPSIESLKKLTHFNAAWNDLSELPESFIHLTSLEVLDFAANELKTLPLSLTECITLRSLNISRNHIKTLSLSLGNLHSLERIDLWGNQLETLPETMTQLDGVMYLDFSWNPIKALSTPLEQWVQTLEEKNAIVYKSGELKELDKKSERSGVRKRIYVTGKIQDYIKKEVQKFVEDHGFEWSTSINTLDILVTGERPGPEKLKKADELGIKVISWEEFVANYIEIG